MSDFGWSHNYAEKQQEAEHAFKGGESDAEEEISDENTIMVKVDEDLVRNLAFEISQQPMSWDDCVWLLAEGELRLASAYVNPHITASGLAEIGSTVTLIPAKVINQPPEAQIRSLAEKVAQQGPHLEELHWFLAVRKVIYDEARQSMY
jgi:hypothetical protein